jgi:hypothetical protein
LQSAPTEAQGVGRREWRDQRVGGRTSSSDRGGQKRWIRRVKKDRFGVAVCIGSTWSKNVGSTGSKKIGSA